MTDRIQVGELQVAKVLYEFINEEAMPNTGVDTDQFWAGFNKLITELSPVNRELLKKRELIQNEINEYHFERKDLAHSPSEYKAFLKQIDYLLPEPDHVTITTTHVDSEISEIAGPQLVVPVMNARYALNAANARWGSLYDALYGTDLIPHDGGASPSFEFNPIRGEKVVAFAKGFLDRYFPLIEAKHADVESYLVNNGELQSLTAGRITGLVQPNQFVGFQNTNDKLSTILLRNNGLHIEIKIDPTKSVGESDPAGVADIVLESAPTAIMDFEDSVAAVDAEDKVIIYRNWLGLMRSTLKSR